MLGRGRGRGREGKREGKEEEGKRRRVGLYLSLLAMATVHPLSLKPLAHLHPRMHVMHAHTQVGDMLYLNGRVGLYLFSK